jgi:GNAT superfamily N-acetyltransferase
MTDEIRVLNANQFYETFKDLYQAHQDALLRKYRSKRKTPLKTDPVEAADFPGFHYTKWQNIERFYQDKEWNAKARYLCFFRGGSLLGVNKVYIESSQEKFNNQWRVYNGLKPIGVNWWGHAFLDVREDAQRQGIGIKLFDKMLSLMKPGDLFHSDMYSSKGKTFVLAWARSRSDRIHILKDDHSAVDYDPDKINFSLELDELQKTARRVARRYLTVLNKTP